MKSKPFVLVLLSLGFFFLVGATDETAIWRIYTVKAGDTPEKLFGDRWIDVLRANKIDRNHFEAGVKIRTTDDLSKLKNYSPLPEEYAPASAYPQYVLVDLAKQFLACYEYGRRIHSFPIASGRSTHPTPRGCFRVLDKDRDHHSSRYTITGTDIPYPMHWAVQFHTSKNGVAFWLHGRDLPGYPASHGCIGLYDEEMQRQYYGIPANPVLADAKIFYEWVALGTPVEIV